MGSEWREMALGDFLTLQRGFDLPAQNRVEGPVPIVSSSGITGFHVEAKVNAPGVVTGRYGTIGQVHYIRKDFWPLNTTLFVSDFKGSDPLFAAYLLRTIDFEAFSDKSSVPGVNRNDLHRRLVRVPPLSEQRAIARILGVLDDKIELNRRENATLEAMAQALFTSWFVDFDPVRAKAAGQPPVGMDAATAALFPAAFAASEVGDVPLGWEVSTIGREVNVVGGSTPSTEDASYWDGGDIHWATPKDMSTLTTHVLLDTQRKITKQGLDRISSGLLPAGTVLLSSRAPVGYLAVTEIPAAINQGVIAMICDDRLSSQYIVHWAQNNMEEIKGRANGTTFLEVSKANFRPLRVLVPSQGILDQFTAQAESLSKKVKTNLQESLALTIIRDTLLPKLLSGELKVSGN